MRHLGWLHAAPEPPKEQRGEPDRRSRIQRLRDSDRVVELAPVDEDVAYLLEHLMQVGPSMPGANGPVPISELELRAWQENSGIELDAWEARTLRRLSREYASEYHAASDPKRPCPYLPEKVDTARVAKDLRAAIASMR